MFKALLKKQMMELNSFLFVNKKNGKRRTTKALIGYSILYLVIFGFLGAVFFGLSSLLGDTLIPAGLGWFYFAMMGMMAIALGTFGSVFNTFSTLYLAKDNELLLSMPIPPMKLLSVRLVGTFLMGIFYEALIWIPACIRYWTLFGMYEEVMTLTAGKVIFPILLFFVIGLFILVLTCILGWVVAMITRKLKNKNVFTVILSLLFMAAYYVVYFRINMMLSNLLQNVEEISRTVKTVLYPFYQMGMGADGDVAGFLIFTAMVAVATVIVCVVLSSNFVKIVTTNTGTKRVKYVEKDVKMAGVSGALLNKEIKRFLGSATYMLNCGIGSVFLLVGAVAAVIKKDALLGIKEAIFEIFGSSVQSLFPAFLAISICLITSMNVISAPSISLEGRSIWVLQSLPVDVREIFKAKRKFHIMLSGIPTLIFSIAICFVFEMEILQLVLITVLAFVFVVFTATAGLALGLRFANVSWTDETAVCKRGLPIFVSLFGGWAIAAVCAAAVFFLRKNVQATFIVIALIVIFTGAERLINRWLMTKGQEVFMSY